MANAEELLPSLFHKNLVAQAAREPRRVSVVAPVEEPTRATDAARLVVLRLVPNYEAPYWPLLFHNVEARHAAVVGFEDGAPTARQMAALGAGVALQSVAVEEAPGEQAYAMTVRLLALARNTLGRLRAPTSWPQLLQVLKGLGRANARLDTLTRLSVERTGVLDQGRLCAVKWARATGANLDEARALYERVLRAYGGRRAPGDRTLRHVLEDYVYVSGGVQQ